MEFVEVTLYSNLQNLYISPNQVHAQLNQTRLKRKQNKWKKKEIDNKIQHLQMPQSIGKKTLRENEISDPPLWKQSQQTVSQLSSDWFHVRYF